MMAIANALEGMTRAEAARLAGMERQALRDAVVRCNAEGLDGLHDRLRPGAKPRLDDERMEHLRRIVLDGPDVGKTDVGKTGLSAWTLAELCGEVKRCWGVGCHAAHMSKLMRKLGPSRQKAQPSHPKADPAAREAWSKRGCKTNWTASRRRSQAAAMQMALDQFSVTLPPGEHAAMVMHQAGWHITDALAVPSNVSLVLLPSHSPELNPVERVWLYLRERYLSHRLLNSYDASVDALCIAWNKLSTARLTSLTSYPYLNQVRF